MPTCVPISELKDASSFARKVEAADEPVIVTKNGYEKLIVMDPEVFKRYRLETPDEKLERLLQEADRDLKSNNVEDGFEVIEKIRAAYGL